MRLFNKSKRDIRHAEDTDPVTKKEIPHARAKPDALFEVSDELGKRLNKMYPKDLRSFEDEVKKFERTSAPAAVAQSEGSPSVTSDNPQSNGGKPGDDEDDFEKHSSQVTEADKAAAYAAGMSVADWKAQNQLK